MNIIVGLPWMVWIVIQIGEGEGSHPEYGVGSADPGLESREERSTAAVRDPNPTMAETKDKICNFLFSVADMTAINLARNIGFSRAKDVNSFSVLWRSWETSGSRTAPLHDGP